MGYPLAAVTSAPAGSPGENYGSGIIYVGGGPLSTPLKGQYAFLLQGIMGTTLAGAGLKGAVAGSFVADGDGAVTSGEVDVNTSAGVQTQLPVMGRYTVFGGANGTRPYSGIITL